MTSNPKYYITQQGRIITKAWTAASAIRCAQLWARSNHAACEVHGPTINGTDLLAHIDESGEVE